MRTLILLLATLFSLTSQAELPKLNKLENLVGTYLGCGKSSAYGERKVLFHLTYIPTDAKGENGVYTASFRWADVTGGFGMVASTYFTEVQFNPVTDVMFMKLDIKPLREFGTIIKTLTIKALPDMSLQGTYRTNAMQGDGRQVLGVWTAQRVPADTNFASAKCHKGILIL